MRLLSIIASIFILTACVNNMSATRITPRSLLNTSSERVSFALISPSSIDSIVSWAKDDKPSHAEINCLDTDILCSEAKETLTRGGVAVTIARGQSVPANSVVLIYDRIAAHDCDKNVFGCSVSANSLQMVADHRQFVSPNLSDSPSAAKAVSGYNDYLGN